MKRRLENQLKIWKEAPIHKPMMLRGIRQVGKTWLMKTFGEEHFRHVAYVNCDKMPNIHEIFAGDFNIHRIIPLLEVATGISIIPDKTLLILDEIQSVPRAVTALKYFYEDAPEYHIMTAGSLLGVADLQGTGFPVGCVDFQELHPMTFTEFLEGIGQERLSLLLQNGSWTDITLFKDNLIEYLRYYLFTGGMPEAVREFAQHRDFRKIRTIQKTLLKAYDNDFAKHAPKELLPRIRMVWNSIPSQLARENRKFIFGALRKGARSSEFELALQWLYDSGLVIPVYCASKPDVPLSAYQSNAFKLMHADVGLLAAQSNLDLKTLIDGNAIFEEYKGALTEQYVHQQLISECSVEPFYWSAADSQCEIDFLYQFNNRMVPHEVKASENLRSKRLMFFSQKHHIPLAVRTSMSNYRLDDIQANIPTDSQLPFTFKLMNLPLYALCRLPQELETTA